ncbi:class IV lanthionine synthetase LanL [Streptomyces sp. NPDC086010]|uniref:class IV lanthionine synthetase LanL n=1 Tax=Streptomyces sp. NPDC086010 TaxID=3365745 RepID=UPI0037D2F98D
MAYAAGRRHAQVRTEFLPLVEATRTVVAQCRELGWRVVHTDASCRAMAPGGSMPSSGWKLQLSATRLSADTVLHHAAQVLLRRGCSFIFGTSVHRAAALGDLWYPDGGQGEFLSAFPRDDAHFQVLAEELHQATEGLAGPRILSSRQRYPGSLVHYRFGAFDDEAAVLTDDGRFVPRLTGPDGSTFTEEPNTGYTAPPWAGPPFPGSDETRLMPSLTRLVGKRFWVEGVRERSRDGSVYLAVDRRNGASVVLRHGRAHAGVAADGADARDRLRRQADMLQRLAAVSATPRTLDRFEEHGDFFVAQAHPGGLPLSAWTRQHAVDTDVATGRVRAIARRLVALLRSVHAAGLIVRDLSPDRVLVTPSGRLLMADAAQVVPVGDPRTDRVHSPFAAPQWRAVDGASSDEPRTPLPADDCFGLGVTLFCLLTDLPPRWVSARGTHPGASTEQRRILQEIARSCPHLTEYVDAVVGLTESDPLKRWTLDGFEAFLRHVPGSGVHPAPGSARQLRTVDLDGLMDDAVARLCRDMNTTRQSLWPVPVSGDHRADPCSAWWGAAGPLAALTRVARSRQDDSLHTPVARAAQWISDRILEIPRILPGLAAGRSGTAWALYDAGRLVGDPVLTGRAVAFARQLPTRSAMPDITHGLSGTGLALLQLWESTEDEEFLTKALECAEFVLRAAERGGAHWTWPVPRNSDTLLAGANRYGFAHGVAGVGTFLLAAGQAAQDATRTQDSERFYDAAMGAGTTLTRSVRVTADGAAFWPMAVGEEPEPLGSWCNGAAGIGTFLIRLWSVTGDANSLSLARGAATTTLATRWRMPAGACCGLSGQGHFLLDMAEFTGDRHFEAQARHLGEVVRLQHREGDVLGLPWIPDSGHGYAQGTAGVLDFLTRLRHGGSRPWMPSRLRAVL